MAQNDTTAYGRRFYEWADEAATAAAEVVVPIVMQMMTVTSVVDVGCGTGRWLRAFVDRGVNDVVGIDSARAPLDLLRIDRDRFWTADLVHPPATDRDFDLAVSLEVAEHLPEEAADRFVAYLCSLAPVALFSAAIPGQEGEVHLNEQWPSYWAARFAAQGFESVDVLRPLLWDNDKVAWFYRQNTLIYVRSADRERLSIDVDATLPSPPMALVHPVTFTSYRQRAERKLVTPLSFRAHVRALPGAFRRAVARRIAQRPATDKAAARQDRLLVGRVEPVRHPLEEDIPELKPSIARRDVDGEHRRSMVRPLVPDDRSLGAGLLVEVEFVDIGQIERDVRGKLREELVG